MESTTLTEEREKCPWDHTRVCPHQLQDKDPMWCQLCIMALLTNEVKLIGVRQQ